MIEPNDYVIAETHNGFYVSQLNEVYPTMDKACNAVLIDMRESQVDVYYLHGSGSTYLMNRVFDDGQ